ncbi:MAG: hypothetical protein ABI067_11970 [Leifsonia sp.]
MNLRPLIAAGVAIGLLAALTITPTQGDNTMAVDNPTGFNASILGEIKRINARLDELSGAPLGKVKAVGGQANATAGFALPPNTSPLSVTAGILVPQHATIATFIVVATVYAINGTANDHDLDIQITSPATSPLTESNVPAGQGYPLSVTTVGTLPVTGGSTLNFTAQAYTFFAAGFPANPANFMNVNAVVLFQY